MFYLISYVGLTLSSLWLTSLRLVGSLLFHKKVNEHNNILIDLTLGAEGRDPSISICFGVLRGCLRHSRPF